MLEQKLRLLKALKDKEPKNRVKEFFEEYQEAYQRLHKPSEHHKQNYDDLSFKYKKYMKE
jgi:hypothetical protein